MKTKPHGYCCYSEQVELITGKFPISIQLEISTKPTPFFGEPICLLSPDTCDKVREFLRNIESGVGYTRQQASEILKLLPEVGDE